MKWSGNEKRYRLLGDPGPWTQLAWSVEDWWLALERSEREKIALLAFVWVICALFILTR